MTGQAESVTILPGVVPRWEWRVFGGPFDDAEQVLGSMRAERTGTSEERYVLSARTDASVKVRDGLMDVKVRLAIDDQGLELWAPTLKADFPLTAADLAVVQDALHTREHPIEPPCSLDEFVGLAEADPDLTTVVVVKRRRHFLVDDCTVESTEMTVDGATIQTTTIETMSVESEDPAHVLDVVARLGLDERSNVGVARGLKAVVGFGSTRVAVIDVGTNSVKYLLEERRTDGTSSTLAARSEVTRLGEGQSDTGVLADAAVDRTVEAIRSMVTDAREHGNVDIVAVGTAGLRRAPNRALLVDRVRQLVGVDVEVISGPEEARLAFLAATSALPAVSGRLAVFDSGGGSTQFTFGVGGRVDEQFSLDVGAVRVAEKFDLASPTSTEVLERAYAWVADELARLDDRERPEAIIAIGGTATNVASVRHGLENYDADVVHGTVIDLAELERQIELYRSRDADQRRSIPGLQAGRAEVILGGACIIRTVLVKLGHDAMTVSDRGLRHGVVIDRFGPSG